MATDITEEIVEILDDSLEVVPSKLSHKRYFSSNEKHYRFSSRLSGRRKYKLPNKYKKILASLVGKTEKEVHAKLLMSGDKGAMIDTTMLNDIYDYYFYDYNDGYLISNGIRVPVEDYPNIYVNIAYYYINGILHRTNNPVIKSISEKDTTTYSNIYEIKDNCITFIIKHSLYFRKQLFRKVMLVEGSTNYIFPTYTIDEAKYVNSNILHSYHEKDRYIYVNNTYKCIHEKANFDMIDTVYPYRRNSSFTYTVAYDGNFYLVKLVAKDWHCPNTTIPMTAKEAEKAMSHLKDFISTK
jgi:hypothetical protein